MRRALLTTVAIAALATATSARATEGHFEGQTEAAQDPRACPGGMRVTLRVTPDREVLGGAVSLIAMRGGELAPDALVPVSSDGFRATLERDGALHASFHVGRHAEVVDLDGKLLNDRFVGVIRRADCGYRLVLERVPAAPR